MKTKKKVFPKIEVFFSRKTGEDQKKYLDRNLGLYSAGVSRIYSCWLTLFRLFIQRSNLDGWTSKSWWGDAYPYNSSTNMILLQISDWLLPRNIVITSRLSTILRKQPMSDDNVHHLFCLQYPLAYLLTLHCYFLFLTLRVIVLVSICCYRSGQE